MNISRNGKILEDIIPVGEEMASSFCCCLASLLLSRCSQRFTFKSKDRHECLRQAYVRLLTASGLTFSYVFKTDQSRKFDKTDYYKALGDDNYIKYALSYGKCNYRIISSDAANLKSAMIDSLDRNMPVIVEGLADSSWALVTGYEEEGLKLYGYTSGCNCCMDCVNCIDREVDGYIENGMFYKSDWEGGLKRIVIIQDFNASTYDYKTFIEYWISVIQHNPCNGFIFGQGAYDANIAFLENDDNFKSKEDNMLIEIYRFIFTNCFVPEYRIFLAWGLLDMLQIPQELLKDPLTRLQSDLFENLRIIMKNGIAAHKVGWNYYTALSEKGLWQADAKQYGTQLRTHMIRKKAITQLKKLKELDLNILNALYSIVNEI